MSRKKYSTKLFYKYYLEWIHLYKDQAIRPVTLKKYYLIQRQLKELAPRLHLNELTRQNYQKILNQYAQTHQKTTTLDFHHHLRASLLDAYDDGLISIDPSRRAIIKGIRPNQNEIKFLNFQQVQSLLKVLYLANEINWDWFIYLIIKTGLRFAEALALTPADFNFEKNLIRINKSWNYKEKIGYFQPTKNSTSNRTIIIDEQLMNQFSKLISTKPIDQPIFFKRDCRVFNNSLNRHLANYCQKANIPKITIHGLRHTHASLLLYAGVSVASVAKRLGHANTTTTQTIYLHIIQELEEVDNAKILNHLRQLHS